MDEGVTFWNALGVDSAVANELAELNVRWSGDRLLVCAAARSSDGLIERVSTLMLALFRFQKFSDSRWCALGAACRSLTAALCVGLRGLVAAVRADPLSSDYQIHGLERLSMQTTRSVVIAGVSMHVADSFLVDLLEDDRVARRADALRSVIVEETKWLASLDDAVWQRLAGVISNAYDGLRLRSECVDAALVCGAFITRSVLYQLEKCPWSLVMGDIDENLDALQEQARAPRELVAKKIQTLLRMDFSRDVIKEGLMLLRDVRWSIASCEQGHGSASATSRQHRAMAWPCCRSGHSSTWHEAFSMATSAPRGTPRSARLRGRSRGASQAESQGGACISRRSSPSCPRRPPRGWAEETQWLSRR